MRRWIGIGFGLMGMVVLGKARAEGEPRVAAVELQARDGLPNVAAKLRSGAEVRIAYLGGSITAAPGWRIKSREWLAARYPEARLSEIHAAIGGTGSDLGVFRLRQDVLAHRPDLLFVEFAVNDGGADPANVQRAMEGIVRQTWEALPEADVCFVYTISDAFLWDLRQGKASRAVTAMEAVADHYRIPSVHFGVRVVRLEQEGKLIFKAAKPENFSAPGPMVFSEDGVHPFPETGHEVYLETFSGTFPILAETGDAAPHRLGPPLREDHWAAAKMIPLTRGMLRGEWELLDSSAPGPAKWFASQLPRLWRANQAGDSLEFAFEGAMASIYDLVGPDSGEVAIEVEGSPRRTVLRVDAYCNHPRPTRLEVVPFGLKDRHRVTISLTGHRPDKSKILFPEHLEDLKANPQKYAGNFWYAGSLLILGDLVE